MRVIRIGASMFAAAALMTCGPARAQEGAAPAPSCTPATWYTLADTTPQPTPAREVIAEMAQKDVVLLGEQHDSADDHRWQLQTLAALHVLRPDLAIGFESFPRRLQPVLDQWIAGELTARQFLERVEWEKTWSFPAELYLPLFQFARLNRIRMVALNVERSLAEAIGTRGWDAVPAAQKEGISKPAPPRPAYREYLFDAYKEHQRPSRRTAGRLTDSDPDFQFFVESQITWDRAMAEALAVQVKSEPRPLVAGIMGAGHVRFGHGVAYQLRDLGVQHVGTLLPLQPADCGEMKQRVADAVFVLAASAAGQAPPRIGVRLETIGVSVPAPILPSPKLRERDTGSPRAVGGPE